MASRGYGDGQSGSSRDVGGHIAEEAGEKPSVINSHHQLNLWVLALQREQITHPTSGRFLDKEGDGYML